jgi:thiamine biosynthesis protein ThiS
MQVVVNEEPREVAEGTTVAALLRALGLDGKPVAVERNREIVPRSAHSATPLAEGDRLEIVTMVGGG